MNYRKIFKQAMLFFLSSGIGFLIDFTVYYTLVRHYELRVIYANIISAFPAITFVFIISNTKIFDADKTKLLDKFRKYLIYLAYQCILLLVVSTLGEYLYNSYASIVSNVLNDVQTKLLIKAIITPITMTLNFIAMKLLIEKKKK